MNYEINKIYNGFKLIDRYEIKEIDSIANVFIHIKSGAKLLNLANNDDNKVFSISFKTPPVDSTGSAHIVEHCVLSGSRKYKTKEPFMDMVKGSLKTFINAMTFSDKTLYPVASRNEKDFINLMDVYLDSVLYPTMYDEKEIFMQEGYHYDIHDVNDPITYKGVVYNEMRGAYSSPTTLLGEVISKSLFPDTTYRYSSGGNPDVITDLSFEGFTNFHKKYYHPSNSYIYIYGDGNVDKYLKHIDEEYLSNFDKKNIDSHIDIQTPLNERVHLKENYSISSDEDDKNKTYLSMNFVIGLSKDPITHLMGDILKELLVNSSAGPVKKALLNAKIGQDIMCSTGGGLQLTFSIISKNAESKQKEEFEKIIIQTINELIKNGIDKDLIESCINISEYDLKEASSFPTKGIIYNMLSMDSWLYDGGVTDLLSYDKDIKLLRDNICTDFYENYLNENIINSIHSSIVTLIPKKGLNDEKAKNIVKRLEDYKKSLSKENLNKLINDNKKLKEKQLLPDSNEDLMTIPKLEVIDVSKKAEEIPREILKIDEDTIIYHDIFSNDISYIEYNFDSTMIEKEDISYISLLSILIGELDTNNMTYSELSNAIYKLTGGINLSPRIYNDNIKEGVFYPKFVLSGKVTSDKLVDFLKLSNELICETVFFDKNRIKELLHQLKSRLEMSIDNRGDNYASRRLASYYSNSSKYVEKIRGFEFYWFISDLLDSYDDKSDNIIKKLNEIYKIIFNKNNLLIGFTGDKKSFDIFKKSYKKVIENINEDKFEIKSYDFKLEKLNEGIMSSSDIQYVSKGFNFKNLGYKYSGSLQVLRGILNSDFLHDRVRAKGGAYGCSLTISNFGNMIISSYRDPNLLETLDVYNEIHKFIESLNLKEEELTKYIIGAISRLDGAMTSKTKGAYSTANYISNITQKDIQEERDEILNVTLEKLKDFSELFKKIMTSNYVCVYGNDNIIKKSEKEFIKIKSL